MPNEDTHASFGQTHWSIIRALGGDDTVQQREAFGQLAEQYWPPVYALIRRGGHDPRSASELTLSFFEDVVFARRLLACADPQRGSLRSLLSTAVANYLRDEFRKKRRRSTREVLAVDVLEHEEDLFVGLVDTKPSDVFEQRWASTVLELALERCRAHYEASDRAQSWHLFEAQILLPSIHANTAPSAADLSERFGLASPSQVYVTVRAVRKRLLTILRDVVAETVAHPSDVKLEYESILSRLAW
ncbi:MAG: sigma-70 family RNA polymerase sigma factor [Phycisphaerales bacterium]|nr:sigma-70 family RNA polymerase sigma factor [Phycisphaerales bacterium]